MEDKLEHLQTALFSAYDELSNSCKLDEAEAVNEAMDVIRLQDAKITELEHQITVSQEDLAQSSSKIDELVVTLGKEHTECKRLESALEAARAATDEFRALANKNALDFIEVIEQLAEYKHLFDVLTAECERLRGQVEHEHQLNLDAMMKVQELENKLKEA